MFRLFLVLAVLAMLTGSVWLFAVSGVALPDMPAMPWSAHFGDPQGCWEGPARARLDLLGKIDTFDYLYCQNGHA